MRRKGNKMNCMQAILDSEAEKEKEERARTQITLGALIDKLERLPMDLEIKGVGSLMSYRGYYCDLYFDIDERVRTVADILKECNFAMGRVFTGYKGGEFLMGENTPMWVAEYGSTGDKLMGVTDKGVLVTSKEE